MLRNIASGPEIGLPGRISARFRSGKRQNRPSGRPNAGRGGDLDAFPIRIPPVTPISGPEALMRNIKSSPDGARPASRRRLQQRPQKWPRRRAVPSPPPQERPKVTRPSSIVRTESGKDWGACRYLVLRNSASGPESGLPGRVLAGLLPGKH